MTERQLKLADIINEIDDNYGIGNGYVDENTDVDKFIEDFIYKFTIEHDLNNFINSINENTNKSYMEILNEI